MSTQSQLANMRARTGPVPPPSAAGEDTLQSSATAAISRLHPNSGVDSIMGRQQEGHIRAGALKAKGSLRPPLACGRVVARRINVRKKRGVLSENAPGALHRDGCVVKVMVTGVKPSESLRQGGIRPRQRYKKLLRNSDANCRHPARSIHFPISKSNEESVAPSVKPCVAEILEAVDNQCEEEKAVSIILDYLLSKHRCATMKRLNDRQVIHELMEESV